MRPCNALRASRAVPNPSDRYAAASLCRRRSLHDAGSYATAGSRWWLVRDGARRRAVRAYAERAPSRAPHYLHNRSVPVRLQDQKVLGARSDDFLHFYFTSTSALFHRSSLMQTPTAAPSSWDVPMGSDGPNFCDVPQMPLKRSEPGASDDRRTRSRAQASRTGGRPLTEYIQKRRPSARKKKRTFEVMIDLGAKLGACRRCTCPVHEADIADGYAEVCTDDPNSFECIQRSFAASCKQYKDEHPQEVAAAAAAGLLLIEEDGDTSVVDGGSSAEEEMKGMADESPTTVMAA